MAIIKIKMSKERMLRMRKDRVRDILPIKNLSNCYYLVRDNSDEDRGDYWYDEPLTYKTNFSINTIKNVYRYLDLEAFVKTLKTGLLFKELSEWKDPYEKRFYEAHYENISHLHTPKPIFACCTTTGIETEANWKQYVGNTGLSSRCVRIGMRTITLLEFLNDYALRNHCKVYFGAVTYAFREQEIDNFHENGTKDHSFWFTKFSINNYLSLLLVKRPAYYTEKEVRFFIVPEHSVDIGKDGKLFVEPGMTWNNLITEVLLQPDGTEEELDYIKWLCVQNDIKCNITKSSLTETRPNIEIDSICKENSFIKDIYELI